MKIRKEGIYRTIDSKDYGIYQKSGWEKVIVDEKPKSVEKPKAEIVEQPKVVDKVAIEGEIEEKPVVEEVVVPKPKKKKKA